MLFGVHYCSISFFIHTHYINGEKVTHSHPYNPFDEDKTPNHQHTQNEFLLINVLSQLQATDYSDFLNIESAFSFLSIDIPIKSDTFTSKSFFFYSVGFRAPPLNIHS
jgi:hypothetical protein